MKTNIVSGIMIDSLGRILLIKRKYKKIYLLVIPLMKNRKIRTIKSAIKKLKKKLDYIFKYKSFSTRKTKKMFYRFLGYFSGNIKIQEKCDGYRCFYYEENKKYLFFQEYNTLFKNFMMKKL